MFKFYDKEISSGIKKSNTFFEYNLLLNKCIKYINITIEHLKNFVILNYICTFILFFILFGSNVLSKSFIYSTFILVIFISINICGIIFYLKYIKCLVYLYKYKETINYRMDKLENIHLDIDDKI